jgi:uncharacterized protein (TIGR00290 family)
MGKEVLLSWSGGKDSSLALYNAQKLGYEIRALITTITRDYDRISMHGVRRVLLEKQAKSLGIPLEEVFIWDGIKNEDYESIMEKVMRKYKNLGISSVIFGDIFLEDVRNYRERNLAKIGMSGIFPIWGKDTRELAREFIELGFKAVITAVDGNVLDGKFVGREYNKDFLEALPKNVDPCGENGEFHTFVYDGPIFKERVEFEKGEIVLRNNRFYFCDLVPV